MEGFSVCVGIVGNRRDVDKCSFPVDEDFKMRSLAAAVLVKVIAAGFESFKLQIL